MKKFKRILLLTASALVLTSCDTSSISSGISESIKNAIPNLWISLAQLGAFIVTVIIFFKFAYKPIQTKMQARADYVDKNVKDSQMSLMDAKRTQDIADSNVKASRVKANQIVADAEKEAQVQADKIKAQAQVDIDRKRELGEKEIADQKAYLDRKAHNEIVSTALDASKAILGREINEKDNEVLVNQFLDQMEKDNPENQPTGGDTKK